MPFDCFGCFLLLQSCYVACNALQLLFRLIFRLPCFEFAALPKIPNAVNVVPAVCKFLGMVDAVMDKTAHVQLVVAAQTIGINNTVCPA